MSVFKKYVAGESKFEVFDRIYEPREDSFLLAQAVRSMKGERALDLGTGCGIMAIILAENFREVIAADIDPIAVENAMFNAQERGKHNITFLVSDLFSSIKGVYDLIAFNPPYLPPSPEEGSYSEALVSGKGGRALTDKFLREFSGYLRGSGRVFIVQSSISKYEKTINILLEMGFAARIVGRERFDFEELVVVEGIKKG